MNAQSHPQTTHKPRLLVGVGLVLASLLAVSDAFLVEQQLGDGDPRVYVFLVCAVATAIAVPFAWRGSAAGRHTVVVSRVLSSLMAVPAFFKPELPAGAQIFAAAGIILALIVAALVYSGSRQTS